MATGATRDPAGMVENDTSDALAFSCPRCAGDARERFYGPCRACREDLRASLAAEARVVDRAGYEPKMNVTANAVALKDD
jgi:hypothetical protein